MKMLCPHVKQSSIQQVITVWIVSTALLLLYSTTASAIVYKTCQERMMADVTTGNCSIGNFLQLHYFNLTMNCTSQDLTWTINSEVDLGVVRLQFDYNYTNETTGETETVVHGLDFWDNLKKNGLVPFSGDIRKDHSFGVCIQFSEYNNLCWIWNEQVASCHDVSESAVISNNDSVNPTSIFVPPTSAAAFSGSIASLTPSKSTHENDKISIETPQSVTATPTLSNSTHENDKIFIETPQSVTTTPTLSNSTQENIIPIVISLILIMLVLVMMVVICIIMLWRHQLLTTKRIVKRLIGGGNYDGNTVIQIDTLSRTGSFATVFEAIDFSHINIPLPQNEISDNLLQTTKSQPCTEERDFKLFNHTSDKPCQLNGYLNARTEHFSPQSIVPGLKDQSRTTSSSSCLRSPVDEYVDYVTKFNDDNETVFSEAASDFEGSVNMCDEELANQSLKKGFPSNLTNLNYSEVLDKKCSNSSNTNLDDYINSTATGIDRFKKCDEENLTNRVDGYTGYISETHIPNNETNIIPETSYVHSIGYMSPDNICLQAHDSITNKPTTPSDTQYISSSTSCDMTDRNESTEYHMSVDEITTSDIGYIATSEIHDDSSVEIYENLTEFQVVYSSRNPQAANFTDSGYLHETTHQNEFTMPDYNETTSDIQYICSSEGQNCSTEFQESTTSHSEYKCSSPLSNNAADEQDQSTEFRLPITNEDVCYLHTSNLDISNQSLIKPLTDDGYLPSDMPHRATDFENNSFSLTETENNVSSENNLTADVVITTTATDGYIVYC